MSSKIHEDFWRQLFYLQLWQKFDRLSKSIYWDAGNEIYLQLMGLLYDTRLY